MKGITRLHGMLAVTPFTMLAMNLCLSVCHCRALAAFAQVFSDRQSLLTEYEFVYVLCTMVYTLGAYAASVHYCCHRKMCGLKAARVSLTARFSLVQAC